jgi:hypothetical protein
VGARSAGKGTLNSNFLGGLENYIFEKVDVAGERAVKYSKENTRGYVWSYGWYLITIYTSAGTFPDYLTEFAELYMGQYPSTFGV